MQSWKNERFVKPIPDFYNCRFGANPIRIVAGVRFSEEHF